MVIRRTAAEASVLGGFVFILPGEGGEGDAGVRRPGDDVEQDDDQGDLRHLPLVLQPVQVLHGVAAAAVAVNAAVNLPHSSENTHTPAVLYLRGAAFVSITRLQKGRKIIGPSEYLSERYFSYIYVANIKNKQSQTAFRQTDWLVRGADGAEDEDVAVDDDEKRQEEDEDEEQHGVRSHWRREGHVVPRAGSQQALGDVSTWRTERDTGAVVIRGWSHSINFPPTQAWLNGERGSAVNQDVLAPFYNIELLLTCA